ncbi:MAG TPA: SCO family protein [Acidobacteriaceae bacterium]|jgi:protein SCO1/2|nr:SCO family protein [Acidobacteriaceae bacterium]
MRNQQGRRTKAAEFILLLLVSIVIANGIVGCRTLPKGKASAGASSSSSKVYAVRGVIVAVDAPKGQITLTNENIPGFMGPMTMPYTLANASVATALHPGDKITAQLTVGDTNATLDQIDILQQAKLDYVPTKQYHIPQAGDLVPDFALLNQSGRRIHFDQYRGKVLLVTFIYTRCPLSNYCPLMSRNFAALDKMLAVDPRLYAKTHLLSISFDPSYDTPAVLRSYGGAYTGRYSKETFQHWDFAAPNRKDLASVLEWFGVGVTPGPGKTLAHSLSTAVIGPDGKIRNWYHSNDWTPQQLFANVKQALQPVTRKAQHG